MHLQCSSMESDREQNLLSEFQRDQRPLQKLVEVAPPRSRVAGGSSTTAPATSSNSRSSKDSNEAEKATKSWCPVSAARRGVSADKPGMLQRLDDTLEGCRIAHANRTYRLNSLGVFDGGKNEVRARSMLRVQMHKELSSSNMRMPYTHKEVKLERQEDNLVLRLDRMCNRVIKSIDDKPRPSMAVPLKRMASEWCKSKKDVFSPGASRNQQIHTTFSDAGGADYSCGGAPSPQSYRSPGRRALATSLSNTSRETCSVAQLRTIQLCVNPSIKEPATSRVSSPGAALSPKRLGGGPTRQPEWLSRLPPEVAAAQIAHLTSVIEQHISRYHSQVSEAQLAALRAAGLPIDLTAVTAEELDKQLAAQRYAQGSHVDVLSDELLQKEQSLKEVSKLVHTTTSIPELIQAALQHVNDMSEELHELKIDLPHMDSSRMHRSSSSSTASFRRTVSNGSSNKIGLLAADHEQSRQIPQHSSDHAMTQHRPPRLLNCGSNSSTRSEQHQNEAEESNVTASSSPNKVSALAMIAAGQPYESPKSLQTARSMPPPPPSPFNADRIAALLQALQGAEEEVTSGSYKLPDLPEVPTAPTAALQMQARLERLWGMLHMPLPDRLDSVLAFTARERVGEFELALQLWERCAVAAEHREGLLQELSSTQLSIATQSVPYIELQQVQQQCVELHKVTCYVQQLSQQLFEQYKISLTYAGEPYPGHEVVTVNDMVQFLDWMKAHQDKMHFIA